MVIITTVEYSNNNVIYATLRYAKVFHLPFLGKCNVGIPTTRLAVTTTKTKRRVLCFSNR